MLKSIDFFRKIQTDQQLSSATGGVFTLIALAAAVLLIFYSVQDFYEERFYTFLAVENDESEYLPMRLDIMFNKMPCNVLNIEFYDQMEYRESNLEQKLSMQNVPRGEKSGSPYKRSEDPNAEIKLFQQNMKEGFQCRISGILNLPKTPGTLVFKPSAYNNIFMVANQELRNQARMTYRITMLEFGLGDNNFEFPIAHKSKNIQNYINELEGNFKNKEYVQDYTNEENRKDYLSHLKIIPVVIEGNSTTKTSEKYRYSLRSSSANLQPLDPFEAVMFFTEIEPINIVYRKHDPKLYELIIQMLAIVGGTVATLGLVNSFSHLLIGIQK